MATRKRTPAQRTRDLVRTAQLYLQGATQLEIAQEIGVSRVQITQDLKEIRAWWQQRTSMDLEAFKAEQLAKLDNLERELWEGWTASKNPTVSNTVSETTAGAKPGKTRSRKEITSAGDPRFLDQIQDVIEQRCKILGLFAPTKLSGVFTSDHEFSEGEIESIAILIASASKRKN